LTNNRTDADPLPSWNAGPIKSSILRFVEAVTSVGGADFVPPLDRIAFFDNDSTLWSEKPGYFQLIFALDRVQALAAQHPEWREQQPFQAGLAVQLILAGLADVGVLTLSGGH
jgi:hypothetical protein